MRVREIERMIQEELSITEQGFLVADIIERICMDANCGIRREESREAVSNIAERLKHSKLERELFRKMKIKTS